MPIGIYAYGHNAPYMEASMLYSIDNVPEEICSPSNILKTLRRSLAITL